MENRLWWTLALLVALCALVVGAIYFFSTGESRSVILLEIAKIFLQLLVIGVLGALAKWIFDEYNRSRDRAATINEFRKEILKRLVDVTNQVRSVPVLIEAHQSARTYGEQMRLLINSRQELSLIRHEIQTTSETFSELLKIRKSLESMQGYLDGLITEFRTKYLELSKMQRSKPEEVWPAIQDLTELGDLRKGDKISRYHSEYILSYYTALDLIRREIWSAARVNSKQASESDNV
jgi:DNA repair exonuclease SbcCD ATPase subunit